MISSINNATAKALTFTSSKSNHSNNYTTSPTPQNDNDNYSGLGAKISEIAQLIKEHQAQAQKDKLLREKQIKTTLRCFKSGSKDSKRKLTEDIGLFKNAYSQFELFEKKASVHNPYYFGYQCPVSSGDKDIEDAVIYYKDGIFKNLFRDEKYQTHEPRAFAIHSKFNPQSGLGYAELLYDFENSAAFANLSVDDGKVYAGCACILDTKNTDLSFAKFARKIADSVIFSELQVGESSITADTMITLQRDGDKISSAKVYYEPVIRRIESSDSQSGSRNTYYITADKVFEYELSEDGKRFKPVSFMLDVEEKIRGKRHKITASEALQDINASRGVCRFYSGYSLNNTDSYSDFGYGKSKVVTMN